MQMCKYANEIQGYSCSYKQMLPTARLANNLESGIKELRTKN
jgi:hypothetical protein